MRIIAGEYRGRTIKAPEGRNTRPTTDRVRESLMSALNSALDGFEGIRVYDVFAGSGALGMECLSRGAEFALFTEHDAKTAALIKQNLESLGVPPRAYRVQKADVFATRVFGGPFQLVMLDPPYAYEAGRVMTLLETLDAAGQLDEDVLITYEHAKGSDISALFGSPSLALEVQSTKLFGDIAIEFLRKA